MKMQVTYLHLKKEGWWFIISRVGAHEWFRFSHSYCSITPDSIHFLLPWIIDEWRLEAEGRWMAIVSVAPQPSFSFDDVYFDFEITHFVGSYEMCKKCLCNGTAEDQTHSHTKTTTRTHTGLNTLFYLTSRIPLIHTKAFFFPKMIFGLNYQSKKVYFCMLLYIKQK